MSGVSSKICANVEHRPKSEIIIGDALTANPIVSCYLITVNWHLTPDTPYIRPLVPDICYLASDNGFLK